MPPTRLYVPAVRSDLDAVSVASTGATWSIEPRAAHAVTTALRASLPDEDDEGVEYAAWLDAVDDSLSLVLAGAGSPLRVVVTVEVPAGVVAPEPLDEETPLSAVRITEPVAATVVCVHVDEPEAGPDVLAVGQVAEADLEAALQVVVDRDLLWYDWSELAQVPR